MKIAVLGSGGWGTALAMLLAENGHTVTLWSYLEEESRRLQQTRENPLLPGVTLPESLSYTWDLSCVRGCGVVVMATPPSGCGPRRRASGGCSPRRPFWSRSPRGLRRGVPCA